MGAGIMHAVVVCAERLSELEVYCEGVGLVGVEFKLFYVWRDDFEKQER